MAQATRVEATTVVGKAGLRWTYRIHVLLSDGTVERGTVEYTDEQSAQATAERRWGAERFYPGHTFGHAVMNVAMDTCPQGR